MKIFKKNSLKFKAFPSYKFNAVRHFKLAVHIADITLTNAEHIQ